MSTLTILISTHDRADLLGRTLRHLDEAARPAGWSVGIMVVANACSDGTHAMLDRRARQADPSGPAGHARMLPLRWVAEPRIGKSHALNCAIPQLTADLVAFVDDDHRVDGGYLEAIGNAAADYPEADILCGRILPDWDGTEPSWVHDEGKYRIFPLPVPRYDLGPQPVRSPQDTATPGGGNLVIRRPMFRKVGEFSTEFGPVGRDLGGAEDKEWMWRAIAGGARVQYVPAIVQYHYVDPDRLKLGYLMRKAYERSASAVRLGRETVTLGLVPGYMLRKVVSHALAVVASLESRRRRFHLVRLAASLGEIKGHLRARPKAALDTKLARRSGHG